MAITNLKYSIIYGQKGDIKCAATQIKHQNIFFPFPLVQTISNSCSSWFINNSHYYQSGDCTSILCCLSLSIIEIGRNSYHSMCYLWTHKLCNDQNTITKFLFFYGNQACIQSMASPFTSFQLSLFVTCATSNKWNVQFSNINFKLWEFIFIVHNWCLKKTFH